jgi:hypothetical protein
MAGLVPAINVFLFNSITKQDVDAGDKRGHDEPRVQRMAQFAFAQDLV